mgnify:FL=1
MDPVGAAAFLASARQWKPGRPGSARDAFADTVRENYVRSLKDRAGRGAGRGEGAPEFRGTASTGEFIAGIAQIRAVERFVASLPHLLL